MRAAWSDFNDAGRATTPLRARLASPPVPPAALSHRCAQPGPPPVPLDALLRADWPPPVQTAALPACCTPPGASPVLPSCSRAAARLLVLRQAAGREDAPLRARLAAAGLRAIAAAAAVAVLFPTQFGPPRVCVPHHEDPMVYRTTAQSALPLQPAKIPCSTDQIVCRACRSVRRRASLKLMSPSGPSSVLAKTKAGVGIGAGAAHLRGRLHFRCRARALRRRACRGRHRIGSCAMTATTGSGPVDVLTSPADAAGATDTVLFVAIPAMAEPVLAVSATCTATSGVAPCSPGWMTE